jgi:hypothetical protein
MGLIHKYGINMGLIPTYQHTNIPVAVFHGKKALHTHRRVGLYVCMLYHHVSVICHIGVCVCVCVS